MIGNSPVPNPNHETCTLQIFEKRPTTVKNFGIWVRYQSRTGYHNAYKEYRDATLNGAVEQLYQVRKRKRHGYRSCTSAVPAAHPWWKKQTGGRSSCLPGVLSLPNPLTLPYVASPQEMGSRHRVRASGIQIIRTATVAASQCKRPNIQQMHDSKIRFPMTRRMVRPSQPEYKTLFKANRPNAAMF
jgi:ribosomal protein L20A (L18A)